ncbi:hypothetical protein F2P81_012789 [Scophthalmus maximus]|uniref:Uncharacterized protein n=1 Tax=Scophthalmus maximus TaxID=52904 RepID=A0A6A4SVE0_SCOMX|nr:hypothetical protein F2P81_012789 [Scophthalmus maximus]
MQTLRMDFLVCPQSDGETLQTSQQRHDIATIGQEPEEPVWCSGEVNRNTIFTSYDVQCTPFTYVRTVNFSLLRGVISCESSIQAD